MKGEGFKKIPNKTMNRNKKLITAAAMAAMSVVSVMPVMAAEASLPTFPEVETGARKEASLEGHTFKAYQIFSGTQKEQGTDTSMYDVAWGSSVDGSTLLAKLKENTIFGSQFASIEYDEAHPEVSATAAARVISAWDSNGDNAKALARLVEEIKTGDGQASGATLDAGYYLVVDETPATGTVNGAKNLSILQMTKAHPFTPENKTDVPELVKRVLEVNDSSTDPAAWAKGADVDKGDTVTFVLTGTLPTNFDDYKAYSYAFNDVLPEGLTLGDVKVYFDNTEKTDLTEAEYKLAKEGQGFKAEFKDLKSLAGVTKDTVIRIVYTATVNDSVKAGEAGNKNNATLTYSNNPNFGGEGETGTTPNEQATVFTYNLVVNKTDAQGAELSGASFQLYKLDADAESTDKYVAVGQPQTGGPQFTFAGIDAGSYKLVEVSAPEGYNKAVDIYFDVTSTISADGELESLAVSDVKDASGNVIMDADGVTKTFTMTADKATGSVETDIANMQGVILPSTGGIGTTIFYVTGGALIIGAGAILAAKKKSSKAGQ